MASLSSAQRAKALREQREQIDNGDRIRALEAQLQNTQIQLDKAVLDAVAQANAKQERKFKRLWTHYRNESATATQRIQIITAEKTVVEAQVDELKQQVEELENAAPAVADAMAVDGQELKCAICGFDSGASTMLSCVGDHHMCSECFGTCLDGKIATGCVAPMTCQGIFTRVIAGGCANEFSDADLVRVVGAEKVLTWYNLKMDVKDEQVATAQRQLRESVFKIVESVEEARQHIITQILTTKCPKPGCAQVFLEFEGCASLRCSNENCYVVGYNKKTNFCAWCGKAWGSDDQIHRHILTCFYNPNQGQYYPDGTPQPTNSRLTCVCYARDRGMTFCSISELNKKA